MKLNTGVRPTSSRSPNATEHRDDWALCTAKRWLRSHAQSLHRPNLRKTGLFRERVASTATILRDQRRLTCGQRARYLSSRYEARPCCFARLCPVFADMVNIGPLKVLLLWNSHRHWSSSLLCPGCFSLDITLFGEVIDGGRDMTIAFLFARSGEATNLVRTF